MKSTALFASFNAADGAGRYMPQPSANPDLHLSSAGSAGRDQFSRSVRLK
jgi:hypothetical protein